jgi:hypothetical protein
MSFSYEISELQCNYSNLQMAEKYQLRRQIVSGSLIQSMYCQK